MSTCIIQIFDGSTPNFGTSPLQQLKLNCLQNCFLLASAIHESICTAWEACTSVFHLITKQLNICFYKGWRLLNITDNNIFWNTKSHSIHRSNVKLLECHILEVEFKQPTSCTKLFWSIALFFRKPNILCLPQMPYNEVMLPNATIKPILLVRKKYHIIFFWAFFLLRCISFWYCLSK